MLRLEDFETVFVLASLVGALLVASPALFFVFPSRAGERFSELYVLGSGRMAEGYPFNVKANETCKIFLGVCNHMGSSAYYAVYLKFRNQVEPLPNSTAGTSSPLPSLYEYRVLLSDGGTWEAPLNFSLVGVSFSGNSCFVESLRINGVVSHVGKAGLWDSENGGFFFQLFFELWIYDPVSGGFLFHDRFVGIWLNVTYVD